MIYIEGETYFASALPLSPDYNLDEAGEGFQCDPFFPDRILDLTLGPENERRRYSSETRSVSGGILWQ